MFLRFLLEKLKFVRTTSFTKPKLVILGTGWGSYSVASFINKNLFNVTVISPRNYFLFTPLLCSTTVGTLEFRSIVEPIRNLRNFSKIKYHCAKGVSLDSQKRCLSCESEEPDDFDGKVEKFDVEYDILVIGTGSQPNTFDIPGVKKYAHFLKEISHARAIRKKLLENLERAFLPGVLPHEQKRLLHIVIVGGGPTGVEFGAELYDFIQQDIARAYSHDIQKILAVTLIESSKILASFDTRLQAYAEKKIKERKGFKLLNAKVVEVTLDHITVDLGVGVDGVQNILQLPYGLLVWSTGVKPQDFIESLSLIKNERGQLKTNDWIQVCEDVFALGDCAHISTHNFPSTAQVAEKQGRYIANTLNSFISTNTFPADSYNFSELTKLPRFSFKSLGMLAYIGEYQGLSDTPQIKLKGHLSWFLWRSAYLTRLGSLRSRLQVPIDWTKTLIFGRDTSKF